MFKKQGFTLIELLIVVAIIAILAAIAVPNFLEAQVRSKVSRVKADFRTIALALEAYCTDNRKYLYDGSFDGANYRPNVYPYAPGHLNIQLSTPIAYITTINFFDPFVDQKTSSANQVHRRFRYNNLRQRYLEDMDNASGIWDKYSDIFGDWQLLSNGPDKIYGPTSTMTRQGALWGASEIYDPTNGTVSPGDIIRCQKTGEPKYW
ncbi:prepilin-type N-terminal cleavage/methylation domain-containing protein [Candidatus Sumerlaeota bacterium]|nr:prepilin-type N-terminal cleavage/methylation domain-containing protein [Candidatus Sumerlaeota bacterium]